MKFVSKLLRILSLIPLSLMMAEKMVRTVQSLPWDRGEDPSLVYNVLIYAAFFTVAFVLDLLIHLAGRLLCGELSGYRAFQICVFHLKWTFTDDGVRFKFRRRVPLQRPCSCLLLPPETQPETFKLALYCIGPLAIVFIAGCILLVVSSELAGLALLSTALYSTAMVCFLHVLVQCVPIRFIYGINNGYWLLELLRHPKAPRSAWIAQRIAEEQMKGTMPVDIPAEWFEIPTESEMRNVHLANIGIFTCERMMDEQRFAEADRLAEDLLRGGSLQEVSRYFLTMYRIRCELKGENRRDKVEALMTPRQSKWMIMAARINPEVQATLYAIALLSEKNAEKAKTLAAAVDTQLKDGKNTVPAAKAQKIMEHVNRIAQ